MAVAPSPGRADQGTREGATRQWLWRGCSAYLRSLPLLLRARWLRRVNAADWSENHAMDVQTYIRQIVEPTINEYETEPTSIRRAFLACVVTYHIIDYLTYPKKKPGDRRQKFRQSSNEFAIIDRVAHALKHVTTGNPNAPHNQPLASGDVISGPPFTAGMPVGLPLRLETVALPHEGVLDLLSTVKLALKFLRTQETPR
jgi:hypothetical protein